MKILTTFAILFAIFALLSLSSIKKLELFHFKSHNKVLGTILGYLILFSIFIDFLYLSYNFYFNWSEIIASPEYIPNGENNNLPVDYVRWFPAGVPQGMGVVTGGLATYTALSRMGNVSPRMRVLASLGAMAVSSIHIAYHASLENSVGFIRLAWGYIRWLNTGIWPSIDEVAKSKSPQELE